MLQGHLSNFDLNLRPGYCVGRCWLTSMTSICKRRWPCQRIPRVLWVCGLLASSNSSLRSWFVES